MKVPTLPDLCRQAIAQVDAKGLYSAGDRLWMAAREIERLQAKITELQAEEGYKAFVKAEIAKLSRCNCRHISMHGHQDDCEMAREKRAKPALARSAPARPAPHRNDKPLKSLGYNWIDQALGRR